MARKNTQDAFTAWRKGQNYKARGRNGSPIWTAGGVLFSYGVEIARFSQVTDARALLNMQKYSVTTSTQQRGIYTLMERAGIHPLVCYTETDYKHKREGDY